MEKSRKSTPAKTMQRSTSKTFISNEVFSGNDIPANERFVTETRLMQRQTSANTLVEVEGQAARYGKGRKPREATMNGILGAVDKKGPKQASKLIDDQT